MLVWSDYTAVEKDSFQRVQLFKTPLNVNILISNLNIIKNNKTVARAVDVGVLYSLDRVLLLKSYYLVEVR